VPDNVEATAEDGNITLTGTVSCGTERAAAEAVVAGLIGVRNVRNDIDIAYAADPVDVDLNVREALDCSALVPDGSDAGADTKDNIITLTRPGPHLGGYDAVIDAAQMAIGVIESATTSKSLADLSGREASARRGGLRGGEPGLNAVGSACWCRTTSAKGPGHARSRCSTARRAARPGARLAGVGHRYSLLRIQMRMSQPATGGR
jgi:BON domain